MVMESAVRGAGYYVNQGIICDDVTWSFQNSTVQYGYTYKIKKNGIDEKSLHLIVIF